jgi:hypothetical protein
MSVTVHRNRPAQLPKIIAPFDARGVPVFQIISGKLFFVGFQLTANRAACISATRMPFVPAARDEERWCVAENVFWIRAWFGFTSTGSNTCA